MGVASQGIFPRWLIRDGRGPALIVALVMTGIFAPGLWDHARSRLEKTKDVCSMAQWKAMEADRAAAEDRD